MGRPSTVSTLDLSLGRTRVGLYEVTLLPTVVGQESVVSFDRGGVPRRDWDGVCCLFCPVYVVRPPVGPDFHRGSQLTEGSHCSRTRVRLPDTRTGPVPGLPTEVGIERESLLVGARWTVRGLPLLDSVSGIRGIFVVPGTIRVPTPVMDTRLLHGPCTARETRRIRGLDTF